MARARLALTSGLAQIAQAEMAARATSPLAARVLTHARTHGRVAAGFAAVDELPPLDGAEDDIVLAAAPERLDLAARIAGALWFANDVAAVVRREDRREIVDLIGADARLWVLNNRSQAPRQATMPGIGTLLADIRAAADAALAAWIRSRPDSLRRRLALIRPQADTDPRADLPGDTALRMFEAAMTCPEVRP